MDTSTTKQEFRRRASKKLVLGFLGCLLMVGLLVGLSFAGYMPGPFTLIPAGIPFVYSCIGFLEVVTGKPFQHFADSWMALKGWQRGIIGTLIVLLAGALIIFGLALVFSCFVPVNKSHSNERGRAMLFGNANVLALQTTLLRPLPEGLPGRGAVSRDFRPKSPPLPRHQVKTA